MCFTCPLFLCAKHRKKTVKMYRKKHTVVFKKTLDVFEKTLDVFKNSS